MILAIALILISLLVAAGLTWAGRLLHISNLDAQALTEKVAFPVPASALEWPELRVQSAVPQPDELSLVIMQVGWPAHPERVAVLLVSLDRDERRAVSLLSQWSTSGASVAAMHRGVEVELRRRRSLERVYAILLAEDYHDRCNRLQVGANHLATLPTSGKTRPRARCRASPGSTGTSPARELLPPQVSAATGPQWGAS